MQRYFLFLTFFFDESIFEMSVVVKILESSKHMSRSRSMSISVIVVYVVSAFIYSRCLVNMTPNVPALGEVANFGTDYFLLKIKFLAKCKREFTTKFAILPNACYNTFYFILTNSSVFTYSSIIFSQRLFSLTSARLLFFM